MSDVKRILVIEDEVSIQELLCYSLEQAGFEVIAVATAEQGLAEIRSELPSIVLLDLMLPGMSGVALAKQLRSDSRTRDLPLIMVTARAEESDRVGGLDIGADDYVTKPFGMKELTARIHVVLRRIARPAAESEILAAGPIRLDRAARAVQVDGQPVTLTPSEFELLFALMSAPGRVFSRSDLLLKLQGTAFESVERTIDVHVRNLRTKIEPDPSNPQYILTIWGVGYKFEP